MRSDFFGEGLSSALGRVDFFLEGEKRPFGFDLLPLEPFRDVGRFGHLGR
jgi:hypothetical protein